MALIKEWNTRWGVMPKAYHEVIAVIPTKDSGKVTVISQVWQDSTKAQSVDQTTFQFPYDPLANVPWAYEQLKTLPEFAGAVDV